MRGSTPRGSELRTFLCFLLGFLGIGNALAAEPAPTAVADDATELVLGRISDDPKAHYEQLKPLLDFVVPRMRDVGITRGRILMARDTQQMLSYLRRGRVDWVTETAGTAMQLQQRAGAQPLLLTERSGVSRYHTVFFVRNDSGLDSLDDLRGHSIAFQNTGSTSAYVVPVITLLDAGLKPEILLSPNDTPSPDTVGYVFARSEVNIAAWVHKRLVDAGAFSSLDWNNDRRMLPAFRNDMKVIHATPDYPRALEMVRAGLDPAVKARLREVLLQAADDPEAAAAMKQFFGTTRFLPLDAESEHALGQLRGGIVRVREKVE
ncbi:metal-binding protein [Pseudoxanthomonas kalamensis DSM 18571]|uniref:phosphate/phosphite/phosphonate ABC transporter substrate-binding protein n=1 Tax=Pseudoxanthomonas kalamensis TaxID=289483 RepID=UPI001390B553|nr:metal-binding protein [Pseudoxanthomonas kalamensis DSM 18571]